MGTSDSTHANTKLRQERVGRNWRQHDVAEHLGTTVVTVNRWERGNQQPSAYFRVKLCALFGKDAEELGLLPEVPPPQDSIQIESRTTTELASPDSPQEVLAAPPEPLPQTSQPHQSRTRLMSGPLHPSRDTLEYSIPLSPRRTRWLWLTVTGILVGVLFGYALGSLSLAAPLFSSCLFFEPTHASILSPPSGSSVPRSITVEGTTCHIPDGKQLWLFVGSNAIPGYYPLTGPLAISSDGKWRTHALIGSTQPNDSGASFLLVPVLADQEGGAAIQHFLTRSDVKSRYLYPLPRGIQILSKVLVIRK